MVHDNILYCIIQNTIATKYSNMTWSIMTWLSSGWLLGAGPLEIWKLGILEPWGWTFGNLDTWKSRALELDLWKFENIEKFWKFGNGGFKTEQLWILGRGSIYIYIYIYIYLFVYSLSTPAKHGQAPSLRLRGGRLQMLQGLPRQT